MSHPAPPKRSLGQHFLNSQAVAARMVKALGAGPDDRVVEIGPGRGALTGLLADRPGPLVLVEKDTDLVPVLTERHAGRPQVRVVEADATEVDLAEACGGDVADLCVIGNLPYNAGGPILANLLRQRRRIRRMVLMFQREVARRIAAAPGDRDCGSLSLAVQCRARVAYLFDVGPTKFFPVPKVWSGVVSVEPAALPHPAAAAVDADGFDGLLRALHAQPRKTVLNSLADGLGVPKDVAARRLEAAGIDPGVRPCCVTPLQALELWGAGGMGQ